MTWKNATLDGGSLPASNLILRSTQAAGTSDYIAFQTGSQVEALRIDTSGNVRLSKPLVPNASDGAALGTSSLMWSDLFLASGAVVNFNNGDVTVTHGTDALTFAGAANGYSFDQNILLASGKALNWASSDVTITHSSHNLTVAGGEVKLAAGSSSLSPLTFQSGPVQNSPGAGTNEYDGTVFYKVPVASNRGVSPAFHLIRQHATYTLGNNANVQKLFNGSTNGSLTLPVGAYIFECLFSLTSMTATSGNASFSIAVGTGPATVTNFLMYAVGIDGAAATAAAQTGSTAVTSAFPASMFSATTATAMQAFVKGTFEVTGAGTIVPSIQLANAAAAVVGVGSYFQCHSVGAATVTTVGNWS